jgi:hypothetical protein
MTPLGLLAALLTALLAAATLSSTGTNFGFSLSSDGARAIFTFDDAMNWDVLFGSISLRGFHSDYQTNKNLTIGKIASLEVGVAIILELTFRLRLRDSQ